MATRIDVRLGKAAAPVGELLFESDGRRQISTFTYRPEWIDRRDSFALAPHMPLRSEPYFGRQTETTQALPMPIADTGPDSWGRKMIELRVGRRGLSELDYVIEADDFLRVGALRYFSAPGEAGVPLTDVAAVEIGVPRLHDLEAVVRQARAFEADPASFREQRADFMGGALLAEAAGSLGGARPKVNALDAEGGLWIVKLPKISDEFAVGRAEVLAMRLAGQLGLHVSTSRAIEVADHFPVALVRRFDRRSDDPTLRIPYISAQTFLGPDLDSETYEALALRMRTHCAAATAQVRELYFRMVYGILIRNTDDHLRNHGFLYGTIRGEAGWRLSPAFDINPSPNGETMKTAISEIHGNRPDIRAALDAAEYFDIDPVEARAEAARFAKSISQNWRAVGRELRMSARDLDQIAPAMQNDDITWLLEVSDRARTSIGT